MKQKTFRWTFLILCLSLFSCKDDPPSFKDKKEETSQDPKCKADEELKDGKCITKKPENDCRYVETKSGKVCISIKQLKACGPLKDDCTNLRFNPSPKNSYPVCLKDKCGFKCELGFHYNDPLAPLECLKDDLLSSCGEKAENCEFSKADNSKASCEKSDDDYICAFKCNEGFLKRGDKCIVPGETKTCGPNFLNCEDKTINSRPEGSLALCENKACSYVCDEQNSYFAFERTCKKSPSSCFIKNGTGQIGFDKQIKKWGACKLISCNKDYHFEKNQCLSDFKSCNFANGIGQSIWNGVKYGACQLKSCNSGFFPYQGVCKSSPQNCNLLNGKGQFYWNQISGAWGSCEAKSCDPNYHVENKKCLANIQDCNTSDGGTGSKTWIVSQKKYGDCLLNKCSFGKHLEKNKCENNTADCFPVGGVGTKQWDISQAKWGNCKLKACNLNYCQIGQKCISKGTINPSNPCEKCKPSLNKTSFVSDNSIKVDDNKFCTINDRCSGGNIISDPKCKDAFSCTDDICDETAKKCDFPIKNNFCLVAGKCYSNLQKASGKECVGCVSSVSKDSFSFFPSGNSCEDGLFCTEKSTCDSKGLCSNVTQNRICAGGLFCNEVKNQCLSTICDAGKKVCTSDDILEVCDVGGAKKSTQFCVSGCNSLTTPNDCLVDKTVTGFKIIYVDANSVKLSWNAVTFQSSKGSFIIEKSDTFDFKSIISTVETKNLDHIDKSTPQNKIFYFRVKIKEGKFSLGSSKVLQSNNKVLMINEIGEGYSNWRWIEVSNVSPFSVDLADFNFVLGGNPTNETYLLATQKLAPGEYIILRTSYFTRYPSMTNYKYKVNPTIPSDPTKQFLIRSWGFFEILDKENQTIDFVRWGKGIGAVTQPTTGPKVKNAAPVLAGGSVGSSIGRVNKSFETDLSKSWTNYKYSTPHGTNMDTSKSKKLDTDKDGLSDFDEISKYKTDHNLFDTDKDGFSDGEEVLDSGVGGINIKAFGANPLQRDIFLEIDYIKNVPNKAIVVPHRAALEKVIKAFDNAPLSKGDYPIKVHFDVGDLFDKNPGVNPKNFDLGGGNEIPYYSCIDFDQAYLKANPTCKDFFEIKRKNMHPSRIMVFHYVVIGDRGSGGGLGEVYGNDFFVTQGGISSSKVSDFIINVQSATIMHELGHNLGLRHGGDDNVNHKPNYNSIMNYLYNCIDENQDGDWFYARNNYSLFTGSWPYPLEFSNKNCKIDFSTGENHDLDENNLNETLGLTGKGPAIDFNNNKTTTDKNVSFNINPKGDTKKSVLSDFDDWGNIDLRYRIKISGMSPLDGGDPDRQTFEVCTFK